MSAPGPSTVHLVRKDGLTDKSCAQCRVRKVKCDRRYPSCARCSSRNEPCEFASMVPFTPMEIEAEEEEAQEESRFTALEDRVITLEAQLAALHDKSLGPTTLNHPVAHFSDARPAPPSFPETIQEAFVSGAESTSVLYNFVLAQTGLTPTQLQQVYGADPRSQDEIRERVFYQRIVGSIGPSSWDNRLATPHLARALSIHLIDSFFLSCCSYLGVFDPFHSRLRYYREQLNDLDAANQVSVAAFCAMGSRASPHSALLGIPANDPFDVSSIHAIIAAGTRREQACRALLDRAMDMFNQFGLAHDAIVSNLEAALVLMQAFIFGEIEPRRSRTMCRIALGHFKDIQDSHHIARCTKNDTACKLGLPLVVGDAIIAAYARHAPLITDEDLEQYFPTALIHLPNVIKDSLEEAITAEFAKVANGNGLGEPVGTFGQAPEQMEVQVTHETLQAATRLLSCWLVQTQRLFARLASGHQPLPQASFVTTTREIWRGVDQVHSAVQRIQQILVNISYVPPGCSKLDGCADVHLRYDTRLDRDLMDVVYLVHALLRERQTAYEFGKAAETTGQTVFAADPDGDELAEMVADSERRVRKSIKLVAFYSQLYITSRDLHMAYHVFWQLELLPNWTAFALQRLGEAGGPESADFEVTETELNWLVTGLRVAAFYHPVAEWRLVEFHQNRRPPQGGPASPLDPSQPQL